MPSVSRAQQRFFGAELARKRKGLRTRTKGLSESQLSEFAGSVQKKATNNRRRSALANA